MPTGCWEIEILLMTRAGLLAGQSHREKERGRGSSQDGERRIERLRGSGQAESLVVGH